MNPILILERVSPHEARRVTNVEEISQRLAQISLQQIKNSKYSEVQRVQCEVREGTLFLSGQVSSYYLKQLVQEAVRSVEGIECVANYVEVAI